MEPKYSKDSRDQKDVELNNKNDQRNNRKKHKRTIRIRYRWIFIAMLIALLFLLNWDGLNFGSGNGTDKNNSTGNNVYETEDLDGSSEDDGSIENAEENQNKYTISVQGEVILSGHGDVLEEISMDELKLQLSELDPQQIVTIRDKGAVNKIYVQVVDLVDSYNLEKIETAN